MFDTVAGLPVHVLVIHAVVVLGPLAGVTGAAFAALPARRRLLGWPLLALAVVAAVTAFVATQSGEALERRLASLGLGEEVLTSVAEHAERGELARNVSFLFLALVVLAVVLLRRSAAEPGEGAGRGGVVETVAAVAVGLAGVALVVVVVLAGHSGSTVVWSDIVENSSAG